MCVGSGLHLGYAGGGERHGVDEGEDGVGGQALGLELGRDNALHFGKGHRLHAVETFLELLDIRCGKQSRGACNELPQLDVLRRRCQSVARHVVMKKSYVSYVTILHQTYR
jgi:hypothetical protein